MENTKNRIILGILVVVGIVVLLGSAVSADNLPYPVNETQKLNLDTIIEATGQVIDQTNFNEVLDSLKIHDEKLYPSELILLLSGSSGIRTNGGKLSLSKGFSSNTKTGIFNVEQVLTYGSTEGSHLVGADEFSLDTAGNWTSSSNSIRCVFADSESKYIPAFCNIVKVNSELVNINSAQISTKFNTRVASTTKFGIDYVIAVSPDTGSGSGFADGTVKTMFAGGIMEARQNHLVPSATNSWKDQASISGGIKSLQKSYKYDSGFSA